MEVYALIGPSGTGKSHRAVLLAHKLEAELIIDDGLIIKGNRIIAGISAKKQPTRIGAIKTALFSETDHCKKAVEAIKQTSPVKVLILGTSRKMAEKIASRLELPEIKEFISIEQIATEKEIRKARIMRTKYSKHVIPAPTMEVRKSLPETIIDPLQVFFKRKGYKGNRSWLEQSVVRPTFTMFGKLYISQGALGAIVTYAVTGIPGVAGVKKVGLVKDEQGVEVEVEVVLDFKFNLNDLSRDVQLAVKEQVEGMTGLTVKCVNVTVAGLKVEEII